MNKLIVFFAAMLCTINGAYAQNVEWIPLFTSNNVSWDVKKDSLDLNKTEGGKDIFTIDVRTREGSQIAFFTAYVTLDHCVAGKGKLVFVNMAGIFQFENDFIFGGGTNGSNIAKSMCDIGMGAIRDYQNQIEAKKLST